MNVERSVYVVVLATIFCIMSSHHLTNEFWVDEFYTLIHFVLVPLKTTLLDYHVPNNHILFSLCTQVYLFLIDFGELKVIIDNPTIARIPMVFLAISVLYQYWKITSYFFENIRYRYVSMVLLCSNVVFGNFIFQYRGYGLSMLFLSIVFHFVLKTIFDKKHHILNNVVILLSAFGAFYTIPSNLYFIIAIAFSILFFAYANKFIRLSKMKTLTIVSNLFFGIGLGLLAYLPMFSEVFFNKDVSNAAPFAYINFYKIIKVLFDLSSYHVLLYLFGLYSFVTLVKNKKFNFGSIFCIPLIVCILPFIFSFLHGDEPPMRVYSVILPIYTILLTWSLVQFSRRFQLDRYKFFFRIIPIYLLVHFGSVQFFIKANTKTLNEQGRGRHDLIFQYHNYYYNSSELLDAILKNRGNKPVYYDEFLDGIDLLLERYDVALVKKGIDDIKESSFLVVAKDPRVIKNHSDVFDIKTQMSDSKYYKVYEMQRK